jgi:putative membrane protein
MNYWGYGPAYGGFGFGGIWGILWFVLLVWLILSLVRMIFGYRHRDFPENSEDEALKILKSRYARGEITKKEFDSMKKDIE